jgi:hypothetical protein
MLTQRKKDDEKTSGTQLKQITQGRRSKQLQQTQRQGQYQQARQPDETTRKGHNGRDKTNEQDKTTREGHADAQANTTTEIQRLQQPNDLNTATGQTARQHKKPPNNRKDTQRRKTDTTEL